MLSHSLSLLLFLVGLASAFVFDLSSYRPAAHAVELTCADKCTLEQEYWIRYSYAGGVGRDIPWPISCYDDNGFNLTELNSFFSIGNWQNILTDSSSTNDTCYIVGKTYIVARLNICNGACSNIYEDLAISELAGIFDTWCSATGGLSTGGSVARQDARNRTLELQPTLLAFNNGTGSSSPCTWCDTLYTGTYSSAICDMVPMVDCNSVIDSDICATLWGWSSNETNTVYLRLGDYLFDNFFDPTPEGRGQGAFFQAGSHAGVFSTIRNCTTEPMLTFNLADANATAVPVQTCPIVDRYANDCDANNVSDYCEILYENNGQDCIAASAEPRCFLGISADDGCAIINSTVSLDCNGNFVKDECEIASTSMLACTNTTCDGVALELRPAECLNCSSTDANVNMIPDQCEDCNNNAIIDVDEISMMLTDDCDANLVPDECQIAEDPSVDCNSNGALDSCEIANGTQTDCNLNSVPDSCDLLNSVFFPDCNMNGVVDSCDIANATSADCNANSRPDECDIASLLEDDCDSNGVPDSCQIDADPSGADCNSDLVLDSCTIDSFPALDCNGNMILDECETLLDCNGNSVPDDCDLLYGGFLDCDGDSNLDVCQITADPSRDCDLNAMLDSCEIAANSTLDCNRNSVLDSCEISADPSLDCDSNMVLDMCQAAANLTLDCNGDLLLDSCQIAANASLDCDSDGMLDVCQLDTDDCNGNSIVDICEITADPSIDCDMDAIIDLCQIAVNQSIDCDNNSIIDVCQIASLLSPDCNLNSVPDECDIAAMTSADADNNTIPDECQIIGACCTGMACMENASLPVCDSVFGSLFIGSLCTPDPCFVTTTVPTTSSTTPPPSTTPFEGSCCTSGSCVDNLNAGECSLFGGSHSLLPCSGRSDCGLVESSNREGSPRTITILVVGIVLSVVVIIIVSVSAYFLLKKKKTTAAVAKVGRKKLQPRKKD